MPLHEITNLTWYRDNNAEAFGEPGITHSFMKCLATVIHHLEGNLAPAWLMGCTGFAFRICINEIMCPSAMSLFDFKALLPEAVEQAGYNALHIGRFWNEQHAATVRKLQAHDAIIEAISANVPAIVWDVKDAEWGIIWGYDPEKERYLTKTHKGEEALLNKDKLGHNGINILSVVIPEQKNNRTRDEIIINSLKAAVKHSEQKEWTERPKYQDGLPAFDLWADLLEKLAIILRAGNEANMNPEIWNFTQYYAAHYYSARCYARDYLLQITKDNATLKNAADNYTQSAAMLKPVWQFFADHKNKDAETIHNLAKNITTAKSYETNAIHYIKDFLVHN